MNRINPFRPGSPVNPGMFVGRNSEIESLETALFQTRTGNPSHFMLTGERGIGKTSMLLYLDFFASGKIMFDNEKLNFLVIHLDINQNTTQYGLVKRIGNTIKNELGNTEKARKFISDTWDFINRLEICDSRIKSKEIESELLLDDFTYSFRNITERLCSAKSKTSTFNSTYDGIILFIDEADNSSPDLQIGSFLKLFIEKLQKLSCNRFMIGIAGLSDLREVLRRSHPSSLRIFNEIQLGRLSNNEVSEIINICLVKANIDNTVKTSIDEKAMDLLITLSEGYPHFIQQFGYCAFDIDEDGTITQDDVYNGAFGRNGALEKIGDGYYRDNFYNKIQKDSYRKVLRIMSNKLDQWTTKREIRESFEGNDTTLNNAIKALKDRHIILPKEGVRGIYRLQHKGFALWIKHYTSEQSPHNGTS